MSIKYKDFSLDINNYGKLEEYEGADSFVLSVRNILLSRPGNHYYTPSFGLDIEQYLFEFADATTVSTIQRNLNEQINKYIENVGNLTVDVSLKTDVDLNGEIKDVILIQVQATVDDRSVSVNFIACNEYNNLSIYNEVY